MLPEIKKETNRTRGDGKRLSWQKKRANKYTQNILEMIKKRRFTLNLKAVFERCVYERI